MSQALERLRRCVSPVGFVAADTPRANYRRVWARDGCVCGVAALVSQDPELVAASRSTLRTLGAHQGPSGQIPSNVPLDGGAVSFGTTAGRIDATLWYALFLCLYGRLSGDDDCVAESWPVLVRAVDVVRAWEHNDGGLVYVPQAGDWADEYVLSGFLLYDQALRLWALKEIDAACERLGRSLGHERGHLAALMADRFGGPLPARAFFLAGFHAGAVFEQFDAWGNALCCLLDVGSDAEQRAACGYAERLSRFDLVPAFDPVIEPGHPDYGALERAAGHGFRNRPGRYHNGGLWPVITSFWVLAARRLGETALAERWSAGIAEANRLGDGGFPEYLDAQTGAPGGVSGLGWSAAAEIIARPEGVRLLAPTE